MTNTTGGDAGIATMIGNYYDQVFIETLEANLVYDKFGEQRPLPENAGSTIIWHALLNPTIGTVLSDGDTPTASVVSARKVSAVPVQYADLRSITDVVDRTAVCPVIEGTVSRMGYGAALTKDTLIGQQIGYQGNMSTGVANAASATLPSVNSQGFPVIEANSNLVFWPTGSNGVTTGLNNGYFSTVPAIIHIRHAVTQLKKMNAETFEDGNYRGVIDPLVADYIRSDTNYPTWNSFGNRANALDKGRLGVIERVYFEESSNAFQVLSKASTWSTTYASLGGTLYGTLVFGKQAYGTTKLGGKDAKVMVTSGADKSDPLNQRTLIGYKLYMAAKVLNPSAGVIIPFYVGN